MVGGGERRHLVAVDGIVEEEPFHLDVEGWGEGGGFRV